MRTTLTWVALAGVLLISALARPCFADESPQLKPTVLNRYPHDPAAFTQGLLVFDGEFLESTGLYGESTLRRVEIETGNVLRSIDLDATEFGEGLARVDDRLVQLTWQEQVAHVYGIEDFAAQGDFTYTGEGWGLCFDGEVLVMSNGSSELTFRDPTTFEPLGQVTVTLDNGAPVTMLNELECVAGQIYANVWQTDQILKIDKSSGDVLVVIDAGDLLTPEEASDADVLNGIAYDPERRHFFITGKLWPWMFEVELDRGEGGQANLPKGCGCVLRGPRRERETLAMALGLLVLAGLRRFTSHPGGARRAPSRHRPSTY